MFVLYFFGWLLFDSVASFWIDLDGILTFLNDFENRNKKWMKFYDNPVKKPVRISKFYVFYFLAGQASKRPMTHSFCVIVHILMASKTIYYKIFFLLLLLITGFQVLNVVSILDQTLNWPISNISQHDIFLPERSLRNAHD